MKLHILLAVFALAAVSLASSPQMGKLVGHVEIGPISPVERPGQKQVVPPSMYSHYEVLVTQHGPQNSRMKSHLVRIVAHLKLSATGDFAMSLPAGDYQVSVVADKQAMKAPVQQAV